jgi:hypothetical protein
MSQGQHRRSPIKQSAAPTRGPKHARPTTGAGYLITVGIAAATVVGAASSPIGGASAAPGAGLTTPGGTTTAASSVTGSRHVDGTDSSRNYSGVASGVTSYLDQGYSWLPSHLLSASAPSASPFVHSFGSTGHRVTAGATRHPWHVTASASSSGSPIPTYTSGTSTGGTSGDGASGGGSVIPITVPGAEITPSPTQAGDPIPTDSHSATPTPTPKPTPTPTPKATPTPTPTKSASPTPTASGSAAGGKNCMADPSACGFPDGTNTGVPAGTVLKQSGDITLSTPGEVVSGLQVNGTVTITASNVTLKDSLIVPDSGDPAIAVSYDHVSGVVIENVEINGGKHSPSSVGVEGSGFTLIADNIHGTADAVDVDTNDVVRDTWIHDLWVSGSDHTDGVQSAGGANVTISHNTIDATANSTNSAIIIGADLGPISNTLITNNLLDGGSYTIYAGSDGQYSSGVITITNNRFADDADYGLTSFAPDGGSIIFTGNVLDATGAAISASDDN